MLFLAGLAESMGLPAGFVALKVTSGAAGGKSMVALRLREDQANFRSFRAGVTGHVLENDRDAVS
jgi:hypothetical protein